MRLLSVEPRFHPHPQTPFLSSPSLARSRKTSHFQSLGLKSPESHLISPFHTAAYPSHDPVTNLAGLPSECLVNSSALSQDLCYRHNYHLTHTCTQTSTYILMFQTMNDFQFFKDASAPPRHPTLGCTPYRHHLHYSYYISRLLLVFLNQFKYHFPGTSVTCSHGSLCFPQSQTL